MLSSTVSGRGSTPPCILLNMNKLQGSGNQQPCGESHRPLPLSAASMDAVANTPTSALRKTVASIMREETGKTNRIASELDTAEVSPDELATLLDRATSRDAWTNVLRYALCNGFPLAMVTLALNLLAFKGFVRLTGSDASAGVLYGISLGSADVVLGKVFEHMFEGMTYTPAELASPVALTPYLTATTLPLTVRNFVRAIAHVSLVLAGKRELVAPVDNGIEVVGGVLATVTTGHAMERHSLPKKDDCHRGILMREDLISVIGQLREGRAAHTGRLARQAGGAALRAVLDVPAGLRKLVTPAGVVTVATLAAFVPAAMIAMAATRDAIHDETRGIPEASAELVRVGVLSSAYLMLAVGVRYASPAFDKVGAALKHVGSTCLTAASRMPFNHFTLDPEWYWLPHERKFSCPTTP